MRPDLQSGTAISAARRRHDRRGRLSELAAAAFLMAKGYRILARRLKTPVGEIDLIARRGRRVAFIEVKLRANLEEAEASITSRQRTRVHHAADLWLARHPRYQEFDLGFDVIFLLPRRWPIHIENGL